MTRHRSAYACEALLAGETHGPGPRHPNFTRQARAVNDVEEKLFVARPREFSLCRSIFFVSVDQVVALCDIEA